MGLFEKVYSPENKYSEEFNCYDWDKNNSKYEYYKKVPIEITDEEYEEIKKYSKPTEDVILKHFNKNNTIATILTIIAWVVYVSGLIAGFVLGVDSWGDPTILMLVYWIASFVVGTVYLGFAEIIKILTEIRNK